MQLNFIFKFNLNAIKKIAVQAGIMLVMAISCLFLTGCASVSVKNPVDPWESWNRSIFTFNDSLDTAIVKPVANTYVAVVPSFLRTGVNNFFSNLTGVWTVVNSALQLKPQAAVEAFFRVTINSTLGLGGIIDVASDMNLEHHVSDFGQTLGHYGVPPGPYLVIPFLGSSTLRDTVASTLISKGDLVWQLNSVAARNSLYALRLLDTRANLLRTTSVLEGVALDKYTFTRDIYLQVRRNDILDGKDPPEDPTEIPEFKENVLPAEKTKVELEKKSELQLQVPSVSLTMLVSEPISTQLPIVQTIEIKPETSSIATVTAALDAN